MWKIWEGDMSGTQMYQLECSELQKKETQLRIA